MYESHFGFHRQPFQSAELARAFFVSESIRKILPQLLHAMRSDLGIAVLTGPSGAGKTSLLKHIRSLLANEGRTVICSGASLETPAEFVAALYTASQQRAGEKASPETSVDSNSRTRWATVDQLRKTTEFWGPILLLIDDAQLLSVPVLNELRAFTEEEWNGRRLVRCLVTGPLSLEEELARPTHSDFSRRIRCHAFLQPLTSRESVEFLSRHLEAVGGKPSRVFSPEALELLVSACDGLPRCLSLLADESLIVTAELSRKSADVECVRKALARLQHLPYSWNASLWPTDDAEVDQSTNIEHAAATSLPSATRSVMPSGTIEIGTPGVIEIGGPRPVTTVATMFPEHTTTTVIPIIPTTSSVSESVTPEPAVQRPVVTFFEVGHRFVPQNQIESPIEHHFDETYAAPTNEFDLLDHEDIEPSVDVDDDEAISHLLESPVSDSTYSETLDMADDPVSHSSSFSGARIQFSGGAFHGELPVDMSHLDASERSSRSSEGERFANRIPVFDRYTWIALGREVPAGTFSVASASKMQRINNGMISQSDSSTSAEFANAGSLSFDSIPITRTSDYEIVSSLTRATAATEDGTFVLFNSTPATPATWSDAYQADRPTTAVFGGIEIPPVVGVEHFNAADAENSESSFDDSTLDVHSVEEDSVVSDTNRRLIRDAILSSLAHVIKATGSGDDVETNSSLPQEIESIVEALLPPHGHTAESLWHDGQLVFGRGQNEDSVDETMSNDDAVPLSFEAARLARDEQNQTPPDSVSREPKAETFFTLPVEVKSIEWDLRSELVDLDEVLPLAESLAALRNEVTTFQQFGRSTGSGYSNETQPSSLSQQHSEPMVPADSLVNRAKRRLEETDSMAAEAVAQATGLLSSTLRSAELATAEHSEPTAAAEELTRTVPPSSNVAPKFSQLFTRLQAIRRQPGEK